MDWKEEINRAARALADMSLAHPRRDVREVAHRIAHEVHNLAGMIEQDPEIQPEGTTRIPSAAGI